VLQFKIGYFLIESKFYYLVIKKYILFLNVELNNHLRESALSMYARAVHPKYVFLSRYSKAEKWLLYEIRHVASVH